MTNASLLQRLVELRSAGYGEPCRLSTIACDLHHRDATLATIEIDDLFLALLVLVDVDVVVALPEFVELPQRTVGVSAPVGAVNGDAFRHARSSSRQLFAKTLPGYGSLFAASLVGIFR